MGEGDQREAVSGERPPGPFDGVLSPRQADYLAGLPPRSLDDLLALRGPQYIEGSLIAWIIVAHAVWAVGLTFAAVALGSPAVGAGAFAHLLGIVFAFIAWAQRRRSVGPARVVAGVSTVLHGVGSLLCLAALAIIVWGLATIPPANPNAMDDMGSLVVVGAIVAGIGTIVLALPTVGGFAAAIGVARDLRRR